MIVHTYSINYSNTVFLNTVSFIDFSNWEITKMYVSGEETGNRRTICKLGFKNYCTNKRSFLYSRNGLWNSSYDSSFACKGASSVTKERYGQGTFCYKTYHKLEIIYTKNIYALYMIEIKTILVNSNIRVKKYTK